MLNPSTASETVNDPTIRRCINLARDWGYGRLEVVNLFAYRTSNPSVLTQVGDPIGSENDDYLKQAFTAAHLLMVAWGNHGVLCARNQTVTAQMVKHNLPHCLGFTKARHPRHPLYIRKDTKPIPFPTPEALLRTH